MEPLGPQGAPAVAAAVTVAHSALREAAEVQAAVLMPWLGRWDDDEEEAAPGALALVLCYRQHYSRSACAWKSRPCSDEGLLAHACMHSWGYHGMGLPCGPVS